MPVGHAPLHHKLSHLLQSACSKLPLYLHTTYPLSQSQFSQIMSGRRRISMSFAKRLHSRMGIDANLILDYARNAPRQSMAWSRGFPCLRVSDRWSQGECWITHIHTRSFSGIVPQRNPVMNRRTSHFLITGASRNNHAVEPRFWLFFVVKTRFFERL